jgi:hypothetical protein
LALDVAGGVPFAQLGDVGLAMALALATSRFAQVLVTYHWSQVTVLELGFLTTGRAGDPRGKPTDPFGVNLFNGARLAGNFVACHEKN